MDDDDELIELERAGWAALSTEGAAGAFYERMLAPQILFLLPGGMVIDDRAEAVASMQGPPWTSYQLDDMRVLPLTADSAAVAYLATATRDGDVYRALVNSTYVRDKGEWRLALHQQTSL